MPFNTVVYVVNFVALIWLLLVAADPTAKRRLAAWLYARAAAQDEARKAHRAAIARYMGGKRF